MVRLKGGCPSVFSRAASEIDALTAAGIAVHLSPGVSSALAAPLLAGALCILVAPRTLPCLTLRKVWNAQSCALSVQSCALDLSKAMHIPVVCRCSTLNSSVVQVAVGVLLVNPPMVPASGYLAANNMVAGSRNHGEMNLCFVGASRSKSWKLSDDKDIEILFINSPKRRTNNATAR